MKSGKTRRDLAIAAAVLLFSCSRGTPPELYDAGEYEKAFELYSGLYDKNPDDFRSAYNAALSAIQLKEYEEALALLKQAAVIPDNTETGATYYNMGNAAFLSGAGMLQNEPEKGISLLRDALAFYDRAFEFKPDDPDILYNGELVLKLLKRIASDENENGGDVDNAGDQSPVSDLAGEQADLNRKTAESGPDKAGDLADEQRDLRERTLAARESSSVGKENEYLEEAASHQERAAGYLENGDMDKAGEEQKQALQALLNVPDKDENGMESREAARPKTDANKSGEQLSQILREDKSSQMYDYAVVPGGIPDVGKDW